MDAHSQPPALVAGFSLLLLRDKQGRFLLQLRDEFAPNFPQCWACFGGGVEPSESFAQALQREAWEELRYRPQAAQLFGIFSPQDYQVPVSALVEGYRAYFIEDYDTSQELIQGEGADMGWFSPQEALKLKSPAHHLAIMQLLLDRL